MIENAVKADQLYAIYWLNNIHMPRPLRLAFTRFWPGFDPEDNAFIQFLRKTYDVEVSDQPDLVFYSVFAGQWPAGDYVKVFFTGECVRPPWPECDWAFSFDYDSHPRHLRLPIYKLMDARPDTLVKTADRVAGWHLRKPRFCNFIYYNAVPFRNAFFKRLNRLKRVDAPGRCMNNMPPLGHHHDPETSRFAQDCWRVKMEFLEAYRFTIAFENESHPGYTTEKIIHAMQAGSIPIYYGNPSIDREFNPRSFINYHAYEAEITARLPAFLRRWPMLNNLVQYGYIRPRSIAKVIAEIMALEADPKRYAEKLAEPWFIGNHPPPDFGLAPLEQRLIEIVESLPATQAGVIVHTARETV